MLERSARRITPVDFRNRIISVLGEKTFSEPWLNIGVESYGTALGNLTRVERVCTYLEVRALRPLVKSHQKLVESTESLKKVKEQIAPVPNEADSDRAAIVMGRARVIFSDAKFKARFPWSLLGLGTLVNRLALSEHPMEVQAKRELEMVRAKVQQDLIRHSERETEIKTGTEPYFQEAEKEVVQRERNLYRWVENKLISRSLLRRYSEAFPQRKEESVRSYVDQMAFSPQEVLALVSFVQIRFGFANLNVQQRASLLRKVPWLDGSRFPTKDEISALQKDVQQAWKDNLRREINDLLAE